MPKIQVSHIFKKIQFAYDNGYTTVSEQGSSRSAKTTSTIIWLCVYAEQHPNTAISVVRATLPALKGSVLRDFFWAMGLLGFWNPKNFNKSELTYTFDNGSFIEFFSCSDEQRLRGRKRDILFVNEANELKFIEWQQLQMRTTRFSILDYNPSFTEEHWINQVNQEAKTYFFISTYKDNPFLEQKVIDEIESLQWKNKSLWQVYGLGMRAVVEGLVFPNIEIVDSVPYEALRHRYIGMDLGYATDPTAIEMVAFWHKTVYIDEICYQTHMLTSDIIRVLKDIDWSPEIISESADPRMIDEIYNAGLDIKPVHKFAGSINAGLTKMHEYKICITRHSTNIIKEFRNYTYRQDKEGKWLNEPIDAFNHCLSGDTLVLTDKGSKRIDCINKGDIVATSNGFHEVTKLFTQGCRKIWYARLGFGNFVIEIQVTPDHKFKTQKGWKQLQELKAGDVLYLSKHLMEKNITYIVEKGTSREVQKDCIGLFGNTIMEKSLKAIMYTILTKIHGITIYQILNLLKVESIYIFMRKNIIKTLFYLKNYVAILKKRVNQLKRGIIRKKDANGILNMAKKLLQILNLKSMYANAAEKVFIESHLDLICSAQIIVNQNGEDYKGLIMNKEYVYNVAKNLQQTNIQESDFVEKVVLQDITVLEEKTLQTYDIEVEYAHEFFANGVLAHNCIDGVRYVFLEKILGSYGSGMSAAEILDIVG